MFDQWCAERHLELFAVTRAHIELYARWLEEQGRARATIARRLSATTTSPRPSGGACRGHHDAH